MPKQVDKPPHHFNADGLARQFAPRLILASLILVLVWLGTGPAMSRLADPVPTPTEEPWVELKKGLKVRDLVVGEGDEARRGKHASMRYAGWLEDGTHFDNNHGRKLLVFPVGGGRVIKGWDLGVVGMKVGGTRQLLIPAKLAYGKQGRPPKIPKNATLLFEINLRGVF